MNDRELLEMAAKAAGIKKPVVQDMRGWGEARYGLSEAIYDEEREEYWNPLTDDGDALRLAATLRIDIEFFASTVYAGPRKTGKYAVDVTDVFDPAAATRRAITRAAAEIGKAM